mmetsp:Transcript_42502/g.104185  ORF Transcript_42502/g.104185 Transcript_42502/m.104185 type:complete len:314 (-) Transcript_42502:192-1133(-)
MSCEPATSRFSPGDLALIETLAKTSASLSLVASSSIVICYIVFPDLRKFAFKLVLFLSIADILSCVPGFIPIDYDNLNCPACLIQAWFYSIFQVASVFWTACITHCLWRAIQFHDLDVQRFERYYHFIAWGIPTFLTILPQMDNAYGPAGAWCWIVRRKDYWRYITFYVPLWLVFGFNLTLYTRLIIKLRKMFQMAGAHEQDRKDVTLFWRLGLYPVILIVCWSAASINRIHDSINPNSPITWLTAIQITMSQATGVFNCLAYGLNANVREKLLNLCNKTSDHGDSVQLREVDEAGEGETPTTRRDMEPSDRL